MTDPDLPQDPGTAPADTGAGGGRRGYSWVIGLIAVIVFIGLISLVISGLDGSTPSR